MNFNNVYKSKKILITGHTGFKGSWLSLWLNNLGAKVAGFSNKVPTIPSHFAAIDLSVLIEDYRGDIRKQEKVMEVFKKFRPEVIFHLAAEPIVKECYDDPKKAFETNLLGTINILECLRATKSVKAAVFITSDKCYENVEWPYGYRENDSLGGSDPYSASKACAELAFSSYFRSYFKEGQCKMATGRAGNVIGGGDWAPYRIIPDCIRSWSQNETLSIRSPHSTRPWQHVLEPLSGYLMLGQMLLENNNRINGESYNFGPSSDIIRPVEELIKEMNKFWVSGKFFTPENVKSTQKEANLLKLCCDKALDHLSWRPTLTYEETVHATINWYSSYYKSDRSSRHFSLDQILWYENLALERGMRWTGNYEKE